jgi:hypothetical protein
MNHPPSENYQKYPCSVAQNYYKKINLPGRNLEGYPDNLNSTIW